MSFRQRLYAPDTLEPADTWRDRAACRTKHPDLFFPSGSTEDGALQTAEAKRVCRRCPVRRPCLHYATEHRIEFGVWGGLSEEERRAAAGLPARRRRTA